MAFFIIIYKKKSVVSFGARFIFASFLCLLTVSCSELSVSKTNNPYDYDYLAVKFSETDNWSIVDKDGKVIVKEEFPSNNQISVIKDGAFWVLNNKKYQLFNIKSPKKPISNEEYDEVSLFQAGRAIVGQKGKPIQIIDKTGKVIKVLPDSITGCSFFTINGYAIAQNDTKRTMGIINTDGEIAFWGKWEALSVSPSDDICIGVKTGDTNNVYVIDTKGNIISKFSVNKWGLLSEFFSEGRLAAFDTPTGSNELDDETPITLIDTQGMKLFSIPKSSAKNSVGARYEDGHIIYRSTDGSYGVADSKGEDIIRAKYEVLLCLGDGTFTAMKNDKFGVISLDDNIIVPFEYDDIIQMTLGGNYIMKSKDRLYIVNHEGREINKNGFYSVSVYRFASEIHSGLDNN